MKILVLNCGSSSVKYKLFEMEKNELLGRGQADRIGTPQTLFRRHLKE
jgi:acetate kinase